MASGKTWKWILGAALAVTAGWNGGCSDDDSGGSSGGPGGAANTPLNWNSTSGGANGTAGAGGVTPLNWIDPNTPVNTGGGGVINSTDERTYDRPDPYLVQPDPEAPHALSTITSNGTITNPEDLCASFINAYRQQVLGIGAGGGGGFGGGIPIGGGFQNILLPMDTPTRKSARAHCKHTAINHPGPLGNANAAGDMAFSGGVAPFGRLAKCKIQMAAGESAVASGANYPDASTASQYFIANMTAGGTGWTHIGVGYWTGFSEQYYWNVILSDSPALVP